jgi:ribonuclease BN (tRNA processing enzyme)
MVLKEACASGRLDEIIVTPDGREHTVGELADAVLLVNDGQKLVYATDFADTPDNRQRLVSLARNAHSLFCEASFMLEDSDQAGRTAHLTTRACAEIANAAAVKQLVPFHFSRRYTTRLPEVYRELAGICPRVQLPDFIGQDGVDESPTAPLPNDK